MIATVLQYTAEFALMETAQRNCSVHVPVKVPQDMFMRNVLSSGEAKTKELSKIKNKTMN